MDRNNHRILKLNFGYSEFTTTYEAQMKDAQGFVYGVETKTHTYRKFDQGPQLNYDSQFGVTGVPGAPQQGRLTFPTCIQVFRHYLFVMEDGKQDISVFTINFNNTQQFKMVQQLKFEAPLSTGLGAFAVTSANGGVRLTRNGGGVPGFREGVGGKSFFSSVAGGPSADGTAGTSSGSGYVWL